MARSIQLSERMSCLKLSSDRLSNWMNLGKTRESWAFGDHVKGLLGGRPRESSLEGGRRRVGCHVEFSPTRVDFVPTATFHA